MPNECVLCERSGDQLLWQGERCRIVYVRDENYPGFCRVVFSAHVREMTDLDPDDRMHLMEVVFTLERVLRQHLSPHKINLASLGNAVPHLHWHVIPRYEDDPGFPEPIWAKPQRAAPAHRTAPDTAALASALAAALGSLRAAD